MKPASCVLLLILCCGCSSATLRRENEALRKVCETLHARVTDAEIELDEIRLERQQEEREERRLCTLLLGLSHGLEGKSHLYLFDLNDEKTYGAGKIATADIADGLFIVWTRGISRAHIPEVVEVLKKEFGIDYISVGGCVAPGLPWPFMAAYNRVSKAAIKKKTGKTFDEILRSKPVKAALDRADARLGEWLKEQAERRTKEEALRKKRIGALKKDMWPLLEKGDFAKARKAAGDDFTVSYREYLKATHPEIYKIEMAYPERVWIDLEDTPVATTIEFLNAVLERKLDPVVLEAPEAQKAKLLKRIVTLRLERVPFSAVVMEWAKRAGLKVRVESKRVVLYPPEKK